MADFPALSSTDWQLNGAATRAGQPAGTVQLTPASASQVGNAVYGPFTNGGLDITFTADIGSSSGSNADGVALSLYDEATATKSSIGAAGGSVGARPINGTHIEIHQFSTPRVDVTRTVGGVTTVLATYTPGTLGTHVWRVVVVKVVGGYEYTLYKDGVAFATSVAVAAPSSIYVSLSAGTGSTVYAHKVSALSGTYEAISPSAIASDEAFGTPGVVYGQTVSPPAIGSGEAFGTPNVPYPQTVSPPAIGSGEAFGNAGVFHRIEPAALPVAIPDDTPAGAAVEFLVGAATVEKVRVGFHVLHTYDSDLVITLLPPTGPAVTLVEFEGSSSDDFGSDNTDDGLFILDDDATAPVSSASPPLVAGVWRPERPLLSVGSQPAGVWRLRFVDTAGADVGTVEAAVLWIAGAVAPPPQYVDPAAIGSGEAFGTADVADTGPTTVDPAAIGSGEAFGTPRVTRSNPPGSSDPPVPVPRNILTNPSTGAYYEWVINHSAEEAVRVAVGREPGAPNPDVGVVRQQQYDGRPRLRLDGYSLDAAHIAQLDAFYLACDDVDERGLIFRDALGDEYSVVIGSFDRPKVRRAYGGHYWHYKIELEVLEVRGGQYQWVT